MTDDWHEQGCLWHDDGPCTCGMSYVSPSGKVRVPVAPKAPEPPPPAPPPPSMHGVMTPTRCTCGGLYWVKLFNGEQRPVCDTCGGIAVWKSRLPLEAFSEMTPTRPEDVILQQFEETEYAKGKQGKPIVPDGVLRSDHNLDGRRVKDAWERKELVDPARDLDDVPTWVMTQALKQRAAWSASTVRPSGVTVFTFMFEGGS